VRAVVDALYQEIRLYRQDADEKHLPLMETYTHWLRKQEYNVGFNASNGLLIVSKSPLVEQVANA